MGVKNTLPFDKTSLVGFGFGFLKLQFHSLKFENLIMNILFKVNMWVQNVSVKQCITKFSHTLNFTQSNQLHSISNPARCVDLVIA